MVNGRPFFLSGMRATVAEDYRFLHIPVDAEGGIERFMRFRALCMDEERIRRIAATQVAQSATASGMNEQERSNISASITGLVNLFLNQGIDAVVTQAVSSVGEDQRDTALESYIQVIQGVLGTVYLELLDQEGINVQEGISEEQAQYFDDAINALSLLGPYGSPVYMQLKSFDHVEASGLQITKSPGQNIVYLGCVMLMAGVFFMFYLHHRRLWIHLRDSSGGSAVLFAGTGHRDRADFAQEFARMRDELQTISGAQNENKGQN
jgi:cytochrome c biogenesis protein